MNYNNINNKVLLGNCLNIIPKLPDKYFDGIITSPPYNFGEDHNHGRGKLYNAYKDNLHRENWIELLVTMFIFVDQNIKKNGTICLVVSYNCEDPILPIEMVMGVHNNTKWTLVETLGWVKNSSTPLNTSPRNLSRRMEAIYVFARKSEMKSFITIKPKGEYNEKIKQQFYKKTDNVIFAKNNDSHPHAPDHGATYSRQLVRKLISIYYPKGSIILDPFAGLGTTIMAAIETKRSGVGIEIDNIYVDYANSEIKYLLNQTSLDMYV